MTITEEKLKNCFDEMVVYKDLKKQSNVFSALSLPSFMRDWILRKFEDENGVFDADKVSKFVHTYLPKKEDWNSIKNRVVIEQETVRFLAKVSIDIDIKTGQVSFSLPDFGLSYKDTMIDEEVWNECKEDLVNGHETWGMVELGYQSPDEYDHEWSFNVNKNKDRSKAGKKGKIKLLSFKPFCPYRIDIDYFKAARKEFSTKEWIDIILGAVDYNADGYNDDEEKKLTMLTRLLPFIEKRLNLIELAPKGTGKSYLFGRVSRFGWLSSGGTMSRAKMFYDQNRHTEARELVRTGDYDTLDMLYDDIPDTLSQLIRTAFIARPGYKFIVSDYSAIEARVLAHLAGETWRSRVFAEGKDIYCASASQMFGVPVEKHGINSHLRQKGKIAELALGYGGSVGALKSMGALKWGLRKKSCNHW